MLKQFVIILVFFSSSIAFGTDSYTDTVFSAVGSSQKEYLTAVRGTDLLSGSDTQGSYLYYRKWYTDHVTDKRRDSQICALMIVLLGASLPLLVLFEKTNKNYKLWVSFVGAVIVAVQGLTQSFHLDESWRGYMLAKMQLEFAHNTWQQEVVNASLDAEHSLDRMQKATSSFADAVSEIVLKETEGYFAESAKARSSR